MQDVERIENNISVRLYLLYLYNSEYAVSETTLHTECQYDATVAPYH